MAKTNKRIVVVDSFAGGLNSDVPTASGCAQELQDVIIERSGEIKRRGGKKTMGGTGGSTSGASGIYLGSIGSMIPRQRIITSTPSASGHVSTATYVAHTSGSTVTTSATLVSGSTGLQFSAGSNYLTKAKNIVEWFPHGEELIGYDPDSGLAFRWGGSTLPTFTGSEASSNNNWRVSGALAQNAVYEVCAASASISPTATNTVSGLVEPGMYLNVASGVTASTLGNKKLYDNSYRIIDVKYAKCAKLVLEGNVFNSTATGTLGNDSWCITPMALLRADPDTFNATASYYDESDVLTSPTAFNLTEPTGNFAPTGTSAIRSYTNAKCYTSHKGRLWAGGTRDGVEYGQEHSSRIRWSALHGESSPSGSPTIYSGPTYWHSDAKQDIYPGVGGRIVALRSMGPELVVVKERGLFSVKGDVNTAGDDLGTLRVDIISTTIGATSPLSVTLTNMGLVIANRNGLYLYDGTGQPRSMLGSRLNTFWKNRMRFSNPDLLNNGNGISLPVTLRLPDSSLSPLYVVSDLDKRISVQSQWANGDCSTLIYDIEKDIFTSQFSDGKPRSQIKYSSITSPDSGHYSISMHSTPQLINWDYDYYDDKILDEDTGSGGSGMTSPLAKVSTGIFNIGKNDYSEGRINLIDINSYTPATTNGSEPSTSIRINYGNIDLFNEFGAPLQETLLTTLASNIHDDTRRIPVNVSRADNRASISLIESSTNKSRVWFLYSIGIETNILGTIYEK